MKVVGWVLAAVGAVAMLILLVFMVGSGLHGRSTLTIAISTFIPLIWIPAAITLLGLLLVVQKWGRWLLAALIALLLGVVGYLAMPKEHEPVPDPQVSMLMLNVQYGRADVEQLLPHIKAADILIFVEYTPAFQEGLRQAGVMEAFPHQEGSVREDAGGTMILSRTPLELVGMTEGTPFDNVLARTSIDGVEWHVLGAHPSPPHFGGEQWEADASALVDLFSPHQPERLVAAGDFNAIRQHSTMQLLTGPDLLNSAHSGAGWTPTWPMNSIIPPFAQIDHVLVSPRVVVERPRRIVVDGTDHAGFTFRVASS